MEEVGGGGGAVGRSFGVDLLRAYLELTEGEAEVTTVV